MSAPLVRAGGFGGGGAGGTVKLFASVVNGNETFIHAEGRMGHPQFPYGNGELGRFVLGANVNNFALVGISAGDSAVTPRVFATTEIFDGSRAANPHLFDAAPTPYIPGLPSGAAGFGLLSVNAQQLFHSTLFDEMPADAVVAVVRVEEGIPGLVDNYAGFDVLLMVNLTNDPVQAPKLGAGLVGFEHPLLNGGFQNEAIFGDGTPDVLAELAAGSVYITLIPEATDGVTASVGVDGVGYQGKALSLLDGDAMYVRPPGLVKVVNQTKSPDGLEFAGRTFEALGVVNVTEDPTAIDGLKLEVFLNQSSKGLAAADAVLLRRIEPVLPNLHVLDVQGNPLDNRAHEIFIPQLEARALEQDLVADTMPPADGHLNADLDLRIEMVAVDSTRTWLSVPLASASTSANATATDLRTQLSNALNAVLNDVGVPGTLTITESSGRFALHVADGSGIVALHVNGGAQIGFTDLQAFGADVEFDSNAAPIIAPLDNVAGMPGALEFNGDIGGGSDCGSDGGSDCDSGRVSIPDHASLQVNRTFTLETWLRVDEFANTWMPVVQKGSGSGVDSRTLSLWVNKNGYLHFTTSSNAGFQSAANTPAGSIQLGHWYHFAGVVDRTTGRMEVYLDGKQVGVAYNSVPNVDAVAHNKPLLFGHTLEANNSYAPFFGQLDEVRLWNIARQPADIVGDMNGTLAKGTPGLVGYWRFNETDEVSAEDASGNGNDGEMLGIVTRVLAPIHLSISDSLSDRLWIEATSSESKVKVSMQGKQLFLTPEVGFKGTARVTVTVRDSSGAPWDGHGRSASTGFDVTFGANAAYGVAFNDLNGDGVRDPDEGPLDGMRIFVDSDGNNILGPTEAYTFSDGNGQFALRSLKYGLDPYLFGAYAFPGWHATTNPTNTLEGPIGSQNVKFEGSGAIVSDVDFGNQSYNDAPSFDLVNNVSVLEDAGPQAIVNWANGISAGPADEASQILTVPENATAVLHVTASDADAPAQVVTFSLTGGADVAKFTIDPSSGIMTFKVAPDRESPTDADANSVYLVQVTANDGHGATSVQNLSVTVTGVNESNPVFTSSANPSVVHWYSFIFDGVTGAEIFADHIDLHFKDGTRGDNDLAVNGIIVDPGAPAFDERPTIWQNPRLRVDVNDDQVVAPSDVLLIINEILRNGSYKLPDPRQLPVTSLRYYDADGDRFITPIDALNVINYLNSQLLPASPQPSGGEAEGESAVDSIVASIISPTSDFGSGLTFDTPRLRPTRNQQGPLAISSPPSPAAVFSPEVADKNRRDLNREAAGESLLDLALEGVLDEIADDVAKGWGG